MGVRIHLPQPLVAGSDLDLPKGQSRHLQVLRSQPGDRIVLFNGSDGLEWQAEIVRIDRQIVQVRVDESRAVARELPTTVTLAFGVPANERMDALVEKATELGVAAIQPLLCERSVVRLAGDRAEARRLHWSAVAASASEQSGRVRVPTIGLPMKLEAWLRSLADDAGAAASAGARDRDGTRRIVLSFDQAALSPGAFAESLQVSVPGDCLFLSGPEGGLAPLEEELAVAAGFERLSLGPRVLRADTAPLAVLAWLGLAGFGNPPEVHLPGDQPL